MESFVAELEIEANHLAILTRGEHYGAIAHPTKSKFFSLSDCPRGTSIADRPLERSALHHRIPKTKLKGDRLPSAP
jgi:hypothetical protein